MKELIDFAVKLKSMIREFQELRKNCKHLSDGHVCGKSELEKEKELLCIIENCSLTYRDM